MLKKKTSLFYKYLLSYFVIFIIPFAAISIVFYHMSVQSLREEIVKSNIDKMEQVRDFSDARIKEMTKIANRISLDNRLTPYMFSETYSSKLGIKELTSYKVNSAIIDELYLYFYNEDKIYSPRGSSSIETFIKYDYPFTNEGPEIFKRKLETTSSPEVIPLDLKPNYGEEGKIITFFYPIPTNSTVTYGTVALVVQEKSFKALINNTLGEYDGNVFVYNEDKALLTSSDKGKKLDKRIVSELAHGKPGMKNRKINKEDYSVVTVHSDVSNWTFVTAIPSAQFFGKMTSLKTTIMLILFSIAFIGAITVVYMSIRQYRPIQHITQSLKANKATESTSNMEHSELENIRKTIENMHRDSEQLHKKMEVHEPFIRDQLLLLLLKGEQDFTGEMTNMLKEININLESEYFFTLMISLRNSENRDQSILNRENVLNLLTTVTLQEGTGYGVELIHENALAVIINLDRSEEDQSILQFRFMEQLNEQLAKTGNQLQVIGVGKVYKGINWINRSFIEANVALEYNILNNSKPIIYFENLMQSHDETVWYPVDDQVKFIQSLKQGNQVVARESLKIIMTSLKEQDTSIHMLKAMCFDLINTILKTGQELDLKIPKDIIKRLVEFKTLEDLEDAIQEVTYFVCKEIEERKISHNNDLRDHILDYIHQQFKTHELSLEYVAEHFQVSKSYLSRFVKEQTGDTFTSYVWQLRNQEFKKQLKETNKPIKEVVLEIGYIDVANFIRKFKKAEGITPGEFRKFY